MNYEMQTSEYCQVSDAELDSVVGGTLADVGQGILRAAGVIGDPKPVTVCTISRERCIE